MAGCGDVLSLEDLQTAKKHQIFEAEVITGKVGGVAGGAAIDYATNQVTGQVQKTLPAILRDTGFRPAPFTFATGGTLALGDSDVVVLWPISAGGDGQYYLWKGAYPKTIPANSTPSTTGGISDAGWLPWGDVTLREELAEQSGAGLVGGLPAFVTATKYAGGATTSSTSNDAAIIAAINDAIATGSYVYWPAVYEVQGNIPNFHSVRHDGPGGIKRGNSTFYVAGRDKSNRLYVAASGGSATNDGLTASFPMSDIQQAINAWSGYARSTQNLFTIDLAAGTYTDGAVADGIISLRELLVEGKLSGSTPTAIIDGTTGTTTSGLNFNGGVRARVKFVDAKNWKTNAGSNGIVFQNGSVGVIDTCQGSGNTNADVYVAEGSDLTVVGTCNFGHVSGTGIRFYRHSRGSISDGVHPVRLAGSNGSGLQVRDGSYVVCNDGIDLDGNLYGLYVWKHSYCELRDAKISNNNIGVIADSLSLVATSGGTQTYSGNALDRQFRGYSFDQSDSTQQHFDPVNKRFGWGGLFTAAVKYHYRGKDGGSGASLSSNYDVIYDNAGVTGIQILTNGQNISLDFDKQTRLTHSASDNTLRLYLANADTYRFKAGSFIPVVNNAKSLGEGSFRWTTAYLETAPVISSDRDLKNAPRPIIDAVLDAWGDVQLITFQWLESIQQKGTDVARWHFGVIAQQVRDAFLAHGLDGTRYGLLCYDEWGDTFEPVTEEYQEDAVVIGEDGFEHIESVIHTRETGEMNLVKAAGNRWGIRADQCLFLDAAYHRREVSRQKELNQHILARLDILEAV